MALSGNLVISFASFSYPDKRTTEKMKNTLHYLHVLALSFQKLQTNSQIMRKNGETRQK